MIISQNLGFIGLVKRESQENPCLRQNIEIKCDTHSLINSLTLISNQFNSAILFSIWIHSVGEKSVDPDQLVSLEASLSGSTL